MQRILALIISVIFQPLIIPAIVFGLILFIVPEATSLPPAFKQTIYYLIVLSTLVIPMITIFGLRLSGTLKSLHMETIQDRLIPFSITCIYYLLTLYFLHEKTEIDPLIWQVFGLISVVIIGLTLVTFFWKMSAHMTGTGGLLAIIIVLGIKFPTFKGLYPLILAISLNGMVASARLYLDAHKPVEVYTGFVFGFALCFFGFFLLWA